MSATTETAAGAPQPTADSGPAYWDGIAADWSLHGRHSAWRAVSDAVNGSLISRWLPPVPGGRALKTDLFDELAGEGLVDTLLRSFAAVSAVDLSPALVGLVRERDPRIDAHTADIRRMPFPDASFDAVVSDSTLDHFPSLADVAVSLREINRVLRPGGALLVTLDNGMNPAVALRNGLPPRWRHATGLVPYSVGATVRRPRELRNLLEGAGFEVAELEAVLHCPRVIGVMVGRVVDRRGGERALRAYVRSLVGFERLARLPTRYVTGHFLASLALKR